MIQFFRKIRQRLLQEHRFSRYLIYAIGEIFLVVIGILIALPINNYNEYKKERKQELKILAEIKSNLQNGLEHLDQSTVLDTALLKSGLIILEHLENGLKYNDSLLMHFRHFSSHSLIALPSTGYESLKSKGLSIISNDSVRMGISNLYDLSFPTLLQAFNYDVSGRRREIINTELYDHFIIRDELFGDSKTGREPISYSELTQDTRFLSMVRSFVRNREWFMIQKDTRKNEIIYLMALIDKELENK